MLTKEQAKKLVSISTYNQLTNRLYELEHITAKRDIAQVKEKIKDIMIRLFTYTEIVDFHDDHILDMAETIAGLYPERQNLSEYTYYIFEYLNTQLRRYEAKKERCVRKLNRKIFDKEQGTDAFLDLKYETWTYTDGYYYQQSRMYHLLRDTLNDLVEYQKKGLLCKK